MPVRHTRFIAAAALLYLLSMLSAPAEAQITVGGDPGEVSPADPTTWTIYTDGYIGIDSGMTGTITVTGGNSLSSGTATLGSDAGSSGTAIITGSGSTWESDNLSLGLDGAGSLRVENGGTVSSSYCILGCYSGSSGAVTITGPGSNWNNSGYVSVGMQGTGTLTVEDGGTVISRVYAAYLGEEPGSSGMVTVTGVGSTWTLDQYSSLWVGVSGTGTLTVENGGMVTTGTLYASPKDLKGDGTINAHGLVSDMALVFDASHGTSQVLTFGAGGVLNLNLDSSCDLGVGYHGTGTLRIADGVEISSGYGYLGFHPGSNGTAVITGAGSNWISYELYVGGNYVGTGGKGTLTVENGGTVTTGTLYSSPSDLKGNGTINASGLVTDMALVFDATHGSSQVFSFGMGGVLNLNLGYNDLGVGYHGAGTLRIADGVKISSSSGYLGYSHGASGTAVVTGAVSAWNSYWQIVGASGNGTLRVESGGTVNSSGCYVGRDSGSSGLAIVTGPGSTWTNHYFNVGENGTGTLRVENGGTVNSYTTYLGVRDGASGAAVITGAGSNWANGGCLYVGCSGIGALTVGNGGKATAQSVSINNASTANLHVSGNGMLVVGDADTQGSVANDGNVNLYADAFLAAGTYSPITELQGRAITWSGTGSYNTYGGTWDNTAKTFTVAAATASPSGVSNTLSTGERLLITDPVSGKRVGASFGTVADGTNFQADLLSGASLSGLPGDQSVLSAWNFTTNFSGDQALLSFDVGAGWSDLLVWHYDGTTWTSFAAPDLTYGDDGIANFAVTSFSGYALTVAAHVGDANKDGAVDVTDLGILAKNYDTAGGATWSQGDFNLDGSVDVTDLGILAKNYDWAGASAGAVPEPMTVSLLAVGGLTLIRRQNQKL